MKLSPILRCGILVVALQASAFAPTPTLRQGPWNPTSLHYKNDKAATVPNQTPVNSQPKGAPIKSQSMIDQTMKTISKTRPFPLFVAEKMVGAMEGMWKSLSKKQDSTCPEGLDPLQKNKEHVVVLGVGWGAAAFLQEIDTDLFDVTVISPRNHFVFTPMLSASSVGSVEYRSICQPVREINSQAKYLEASALQIDPDKCTVSCESVICNDGNEFCEFPDYFDVHYDRLVVSVGAETNTFGIPGVEEHCHFLKDISDARGIRTKLVNCFERASVPGLTDEEKRDRLAFVVIGAGPAGVEFTAELRDFIEQDCPKYYHDLLPFISIKLVEASNTVLAPFEKPLQDEAVKRITKATNMICTAAKDAGDFELLQLLKEAPVVEVSDEKIHLKDGRVLDYAMAVWAGGIKPLPITCQIVGVLGAEQKKQQDKARGRIAVDHWLRAYGGHGRIMAFGDCSTNPDEPLPPTGQVAAQQGSFLAHLMDEKFDFSPPSTIGSNGQSILPPPTRIDGETLDSLEDSIAALATHHSEYAKPFQYLDLGILAYTGDCTALAQVSTTPSTPKILSKGKFGNFLWRSVYLAKQVSWRNRLLVASDWLKRSCFGRDISRYAS